MKKRGLEESSYVVRPPVVGDATELGRLHCRVWQQTYADSMDQAAFEALSPKTFADNWARGLSNPDTTRPQTLVAEHRRDGIVGFITAGPAGDDDAPVPQRLWALNVASEHHGTGLAQQLMVHGLGDGPAYLWVAHGNARAIRFYRQHGFSTDGPAVIDEHTGIREQRMVRRG